MRPCTARETSELACPTSLPPRLRSGAQASLIPTTLDTNLGSVSLGSSLADADGHEPIPLDCRKDLALTLDAGLPEGIPRTCSASNLARCSHTLIEVAHSKELSCGPGLGRAGVISYRQVARSRGETMTEEADCRRRAHPALNGRPGILGPLCCG
jgi:hypothetical protein